ncbi:hypothetical protein PHET_00426 [Paragonimus heterotremus]|uniref:Protein kinase C n=1 Tax=Paragonimus heterotremus TaxID=100268 RepID=A0A8J4SUU5_9TREM|nr:hypothetical protein PHET_00426 [Paragonimus heterotremus]
MHCNTTADIQYGSKELKPADDIAADNRLAVDVHTFQVHNFRSPHFCDFCGQVMFGLVRQGLKCTGCGQNFHKRCAYKIPNSCTRQKATFTPSSSVDSVVRVRTMTSQFSSDSQEDVQTRVAPRDTTNDSVVHRQTVLMDSAQKSPKETTTKDSVDFVQEDSSLIHCHGLDFYSTHISGNRAVDLNSQIDGGPKTTSDAGPIKVGQIRPITSSSMRTGGLTYGRPLWSQQVVTTPVEVPHTFELHRSAKPNVCQHCHRLLHGLFRQGLHCKDCKMWVHKKCAALVPKNCEGEQFVSEETLNKERTASEKTGSFSENAFSGALRLKKRLFLRGQTVSTINAPSTPELNRSTAGARRERGGLEPWRRQNTDEPVLSGGHGLLTDGQITGEPTVSIQLSHKKEQNVIQSSLESSCPSTPPGLDHPSVVISGGRPQKISFRSQHRSRSQKEILFDATANVESNHHQQQNHHPLPQPSVDIEETAESGVKHTPMESVFQSERTRSIERPSLKPRPSTTQNGPRNIPLMRVIQSARHIKRPGTGLIIRESWMVHRTNKDPQLRRHFWRLGAKSIIMFYHEKTNRYYKELALNTIVSLDPAGTNSAFWDDHDRSIGDPRSELETKDASIHTSLSPVANSPARVKLDHVFEIRCVDGTVYYVGQLAYGEVLDNDRNGPIRGNKGRRKSHFPGLPMAQSFVRKASAPVYGLIHLGEPSALNMAQSPLTNPLYVAAPVRSPDIGTEEEINHCVYRAAILPPPPGTGLDIARHLETALRQSLLPLTSKLSTQPEPQPLSENNSKSYRNEQGKLNDRGSKKNESNEVIQTILPTPDKLVNVQIPQIVTELVPSTPSDKPMQQDSEKQNQRHFGAKEILSPPNELEAAEDEDVGEGCGISSFIDSGQCNETGVRALYEIFPDEVLGSGQFGIVYAGRHRKTQREVAIKVIDKLRFPTKREAQLKNEVFILRVSFC